MKMNDRSEESEEKCGPVARLDAQERGEERVSFREISVSINARPGANELSLIDHWTPVVRGNLIQPSSASSHPYHHPTQHTMACVGRGTQFNFTARSYFLHFSWIKMKLNSVGGTRSEKCKITFNVQYPTQNPKNATLKPEQAGMIHLIFHIKHQVVFSCLTQCEGDRWRSLERVIPPCLSVICLDTGDARNSVSDHVTQIIGKKDWGLTSGPECGGGAQWRATRARALPGYLMSAQICLSFACSRF